MPGKLKKQLTKRHRRELFDESGIAPEVVRARRYRSMGLSDRAELISLGFPAYQAKVPGMLVPTYGVDGKRNGQQFKSDGYKPKSKRPKYENPEGSRNVVDCPPTLGGRLTDPSEPLYITEGIKKADAAVSQGLCCVSIAGVDSWRGTLPDGSKGPLRRPLHVRPHRFG